MNTNAADLAMNSITLLFMCKDVIKSLFNNRYYTILNPIQLFTIGVSTMRDLISSILSEIK